MRYVKRMCVKNTSETETVRNVLFNMEATVEGTTTIASYAAFLPTSGSNSVYTNKIGPGETYEMNIEMEAKADLGQKPYVLTVKMQYQSEDLTEYTDEAKVSIPVKVIYESDNVESGITYIGNLEPGATGNVDSMLTGKSVSESEENVKVKITYEDESGNETQEEKAITVAVTEPVVEEVITDQTELNDDGEQNQNGKKFIVIGTIVAALIIIIVVILLVKKNKRRREDVLSE